MPTVTGPYGNPGAPHSIEWQDSDVVGETTNPFNVAQTIYPWGQSLMEVSFSMPSMPPAQFRAWQVFLRLLEGINGVFLSVADNLNQNPQNPSATAPTVNGVNASGSYSLNVTGGSNMTAGDWFAIPGNGAFATGSRLYQITGISGGTWTIWPPIREATLGSETLVIRGAQGVWRLKSNVRKYAVSTDRVYGVTFEFREAL